MGVIVFVLAILPQKETRSMHIMRAEIPGPTVGKLVSKTMLTARILYYFYTVITLIEALVLYLGNTPFFDSITIAFSTAGTGGFAIKNASIAAYNSLYIEVVRFIVYDYFRHQLQSVLLGLDSSGKACF